MITAPGMINASSMNAQNVITSGRLYAALGSILILTLQFQTLPLPIQVQNMPLTTVLALLFLPFVLHDLRMTPVSRLLLVFFLFAFMHSLVALVYELLQSGRDIRFVSWLRQAVAITGGVASFMVFRYLFRHMHSLQIARSVLIGTIPALLLALLNILWGALGQSWAGNIVEGIREFVAPLGYTSPLRASGFATEPSTFAGALGAVVAPTLLFLAGIKRHRGLIILFSLLAIASFIWTFSTSGLIIVLGMIVLGLFTGPGRSKLAAIGVVLTLFIVAAMILFPQNQITRHAGALAKRKVNVSMIDRYYSTTGPFINSMSSWTMLGYGLGGTATHFKEIVPREAQAEILSAKWKDLPNLATLVGRVFAEIGLLGLTLFLMIVALVLREYRVARGRRFPPIEKSFLQTARLGFLLTLLSTMVVFGSFHVPYLWFWMAVIDSRFMVEEESARKVVF